MALIIATRPILYGGRMYDPGAQLPATDTRMVQAWLTHGSAREIVPTGKADIPAAVVETPAPAETEKDPAAARPIPAPTVKGRTAKRKD